MGLVLTTCVCPHFPYFSPRYHNLLIILLNFNCSIKLSLMFFAYFSETPGAVSTDTSLGVQQQKSCRYLLVQPLPVSISCFVFPREDNPPQLYFSIHRAASLAVVVFREYKRIWSNVTNWSSKLHPPAFPPRFPHFHFFFVFSLLLARNCDYITTVLYRNAAFQHVVSNVYAKSPLLHTFNDRVV